MKKIGLSCLIAIIMLSTVSFLRAEASFYGSARLYYWYDHTDEDWNNNELGINESNLDLNYGMQGNSRLGANFSTNGVTGKAELGISPSDVNLRLLYGKVTKGDYAITIGQDYTGFTAYGDQVYDDDLNFIYYGLFYDGRLPLVRLTYNDRYHIMFVTPKEVDVTELGGLQTLVPKVNLAYEYTDSKFYFAASAGININQYNEDYNAAKLDDMILAYAGTFTGKYDFGKVNILGQLSYGVNVANYGIYTITNSAIVYDDVNNSFEDTNTLGGLMILSSDILTGGVSYVQSSNTLWSDDDTAMSAFIQKKVSISENLFLVPEVGLFDHMENHAGVAEGMKIYGGMKIQLDM